MANSIMKRPWWLLVIIIICIIPVFSFPAILGMINPADETAKIMSWFYLFYVFATGYLAWICWPERKAVTWILLAILLLSHVAMWSMVLYEH